MKPQEFDHLDDDEACGCGSGGGPGATLDEPDLESQVYQWMIGKFGADYIKAVDVGVGTDGLPEVVAHVSKVKRFKQRWKSVCLEACGHHELLSMLRCEHFSLFAIRDG